jgi:hypothetical protein
MNSAQRFEFQTIRQDQDRLHDLIQDLDRRIEVLGRNVIEAPEPTPRLPNVVEAKPPARTAPPPLPSAVKQPEIAASVPAAQALTEEDRAATPQRVPLLSPPAESDSTDVEPLELRVGTFWLARIGIVILLTGLVFLGNYAYHLIVPMLGPWGKVSLMMMAGLGLGGAGYWMEKSKESLRNFGRVLLGGGAAAIYYTTYAAHYVQGLRVIESALLGGLFLLAVAGGIAWYAERKRSQTIASLAVLLSYYTSAINSIAGFTLFSSLLLTAVAVYFLVRHQWVRLSALSMVATYGSYAFWRYHQLAQSGSTGEFGMGLGFLAGYWVLFSAAVIFATMRAPDRVAFLTMNNAAFFAFASHHFANHLPNAFWMFSIGFGGVLLALAAVTAYRDAEGSAVDGAFLAQGLIAITVGFVAKFSGPQLSMILALESAALLVCTRRRHGLLFEIGAGLCAIGAFFLAIAQIDSVSHWAWHLGTPIAALLLFDAWWIKYLRGELHERLVSARALVFTTLGLVLVGCVAWSIAPPAWRPVTFALIPLFALAAFRVRLAELGFAAQLFVFLAGGLVLARVAGGHSFPWWTPASVVGSSVLLLHWWQARKADDWREASHAMQLVLAVVAAGVGICWMKAFVHGDTWLIATSLAAIGTAVYGLITRAWPVALVGQIFSVLSVGSFLVQISNGHPAWSATLVPVGTTAIISLLISRWAVTRWPALPESMTYGEIARCYRIAGAMLFAVWSFEYVSAEWRVAFFAIGGALQIAAGSVFESKARIVSGTLYALAGVVLFWMGLTQTVMFLDLVALIAIPASLRISSHISGGSPLPKPLRNALVSLVLLSVWFWVTRWTLDRGILGHLTTSWTLLALVVFGAGLALRERVYRLGGFAILGFALARLFVFDVWKFDSLYRIVSFLVFGAALLTLSFVYNRFSETLRKYL